MAAPVIGQPGVYSIHAKLVIQNSHLQFASRVLVTIIVVIKEAEISSDKVPDFLLGPVTAWEQYAVSSEDW